MNHPDDPIVHYLPNGITVCPDTPDNRARFERHDRDRQYRKPPVKKKHPSADQKAEAYKQAFRQPQGAYDRGICGRY